jgi:lipopolysaccharide transport system ATP-binding protein
MSAVIEVKNLSKAYQLGQINTGTLYSDLQRWWAIKRGKEDPFLKVGETNDRTSRGTSNIVWSLKDLNFEINEGDSIGIIGRNGAGKSTLLKLLSRITSPTTGSIRIKGKMASLLEVGTGFHPELSGRENIFLNGAILGMRKAEIKEKFDEIVDFSGVERYIDTPVKRYSSGMYVRLAFAVAAHLDSEILIVDEVLAVGDAEFQKKCLGKMNELGHNTGRTIVFVSHNMSSIKSLCSTSLYMNQGRLVSIGETSEIISEYLSAANNSYAGDGLIPSGTSSHGTGEARFKKLLLKNRDMIPQNEFYFGESIGVEIELDVYEDIPGALIGLHLLNMYGEKMSMDIPDKSYKPYPLKSGKYKFKVTLSDVLMPGNFSFGLSLSHFSSGSDIDVIETFAAFKILKESVNKDMDYPWLTVHGYFRPNSIWEIEKMK